MLCNPLLRANFSLGNMTLTEDKIGRNTYLFSQKNCVEVRRKKNFLSSEHVKLKVYISCKWPDFKTSSDVTADFNIVYNQIQRKLIAV